VYEIKELISAQRKSGVYLSVLGFGLKNYSDANMSALAQAGNGNYAFIDGDEEAARALVREREGTLVTVAREMKIQVEFNPARVQSYRLLGYQSRALAARAFNDDREDGGELGAGQSVTALYELIPVPVTQEEAPPLDAPRYAPTPAPLKIAAAAPAEPQGGPATPPRPSAAPAPNALDAEWLNVKVRYVPQGAPQGAPSVRAEHPVVGAPGALYTASLNHRAALSLALLSEQARQISPTAAPSQLLAFAAPQAGDLATPEQLKRLKEITALSARLTQIGY
jgi:hypothetical protein